MSDLAGRKSVVYVETSVPSYLVAKPSANPVTANQQRITRLWWVGANRRFDLVQSEVVIDEISRGDPRLAQDRLTAVRHVPALPLTRAVIRLASRYRRELRLPPRAKTDSLHIGFAVAHHVDYLVTWNCAHIANRVVIGQIAAMNQRRGLWMPAIVTPEDLVQEMTT